MPPSFTTTAFVTSALEVPRAQAAGVELLCVEIELKATLRDPAFAVLAEEERAHAASFLRHEDALRHAATRGALRETLSKRLNVAANSLQFERDANGRPRLAWEAFNGLQAPLDFNVSHAGRYALIALAEGRRVGIDIESRDCVGDWSALSTAVFTSRDQDYVMSLPEHQRGYAFYDVWTAKEAFLKALGTGLAAGMTNFSVLGDNDNKPVAIPVTHIPVNGTQPLSCVTAFDAAWCPAPAGYAACVAWSREIFI